jgi:hypothetical protein
VRRGHERGRGVDSLRRGHDGRRGGGGVVLVVGVVGVGRRRRSGSSSRGRIGLLDLLRGRAALKEAVDLFLILF